MAANKEKSRIRLCAVYRRLMKVQYPKCPLERRVVKLNERNDQLSKYTNSIWADMYKNGFIPNEGNEQSQFFDAFDQISKNTIEIEKNNTAIDKICHKLNIDERTILSNHSKLNMRLNTSY